MKKSSKTVAKKKLGRPELLTPEMANMIVGMLQAGITVTIACETAGINIKTFERWVNKGKEAEPGTNYALFADGVKKARAMGEVNLVNILQKWAPKEPKWAAWLLERMFGERYGKKVEQTLTTAADKPITVMFPAVMATPRIAKKAIHEIEKED